MHRIIEVFQSGIKSMYIVPDANIIIGADYGRSPPFRDLLSTLESLPHNICIPRVVVEEVVGRFARDFDEDLREIRRRMRDLAIRLDKDLSSTVNNMDEALDKASEVSSFRERLEAQFDRILDYPDMEHEVLVERAVTRIKPFNEEGVGYRDALIWETVLKLASEVDSEVAFISNDRDFSNQKRELHNELTNQMDERGVSRDRVILFRSLGGFIAYLQSDLPEVPIE